MPTKARIIVPHRLAAVLAAVACVVPQQQVRADTSTINAIAVYASVDDDRPGGCEVASRVIESQMALALSRNGYSIAAGKRGDVKADAYVTTVGNAQRCASSNTVVVRYLAYVADPWDNKKALRGVELCNQHTVLTAPRDLFQKGVSESVVRQLETCLGTFKLNK